MPETTEEVYATESSTIPGRVSQRATCYHTDEDCRQVDAVTPIDWSVVEKRSL